MPPPASSTELLELVTQSGLVERQFLDGYHHENSDALTTATHLVTAGLLTNYQANQLLSGKYRGFTLGPFRILDKIGGGGMGQVFLCEHQTLHRKVAVKVLPPESAKDTEALGRFHREARAAAALDHPNVVRAFDVGEADGVHYLALEYIDGLDLHAVLQKHGPLPYRQAVAYIAQAALGLQHAFETGLIHRDIKPANLLVDRVGTVKILDFGLARFFDATDDGLTRKHGGEVMGTADYIAPEQAVDSTEVDIRTDIYSLGATFYALLTGKPPFSGTTTQKLLAHQMRPPAPLHLVRPGVPEGLSNIVLRMMAKDPVERYQTPAEVVTALQPWLTGDAEQIENASGEWAEVFDDANVATVPVSAQSTHSKLRRETETRTLRWGGIAALVAGVAALGIAGWVLIKPRPQPAPLNETSTTTEVPGTFVKPGNPGAPSVVDIGRIVHSNKVNFRALAFGPGGSDLVAITLQGSFYVYDVANAIQRHKPTWPASKLQLLVVTPDGKRAVVGPGKGRLRITDVQTGGSSGEIGNPNETFLDLAAASDNRRVLAGSADNVARLWDLTTGQELKVYKGHENNVLAVAITPSCRWVATGAGALDSKGPVDHSVRVWEMNSGNQTRVFDDATRPITKLAFSSDDKLLAAGDLSGMVRVYHIFDAKRVWQAEIGGTPVTALHFLPDGRLLCACGADREVQVRDGSGAKVGGWVAQHAACVAVSANGKLVATGSDQVIQLWRFPGAKD